MPNCPCARTDRALTVASIKPSKMLLATVATQVDGLKVDRFFIVVSLAFSGQFLTKHRLAACFELSKVRKGSQKTVKTLKRWPPPQAVTCDKPSPEPQQSINPIIIRPATSLFALRLFRLS